MIDVVEQQSTAEELPEGWRWVKIGDVCVSKTGTINLALQPEDTFYYVDISSVDNKTKRIVEAKALLGKDAPSRARQCIRANDVIVSTTRPNLNAVALIPDDLDNQVCSTGFCVLRSDVDIHPQYLFAYVQSQAFISKLSDLVKGALYPAVTDVQVREQYIPLPPLSEQQRIARILTEQFAEVEQARAAAEAQLAATQELGSAYLHQIFEGEDAQSWPLVELEHITIGNGQYGTSEKSSAEPIGPVVLRMGNIVDGQLDWSNLKYGDLPKPELEKYLLSPGDILFNRTNSAELVGKTAVYQGEYPAIFASYLIRFRVRPDLADPRFISAYINSTGRSFIERHMARAIGQVNISASTMSKMPIPCPPLAVQRETMDRLDEQQHALRTLRTTLIEQLNSITTLPAALLRQAFSGAL